MLTDIFEKAVSPGGRYNQELVVVKEKHLELAKQEEPDLICVSMHWGTEYRLTPHSSQEELADFLFENGVDIILGERNV